MIDSKIEKKKRTSSLNWLLEEQKQKSSSRACMYFQAEPRHLLLDISIRLTKVKGIECFSVLFYMLVEERGRTENSMRPGNWPKVKKRKIQHKAA